MGIIRRYNRIVNPAFDFTPYSLSGTRHMFQYFDFSLDEAIKYSGIYQSFPYSPAPPPGPLYTGNQLRLGGHFGFAALPVVENEILNSYEVGITLWNCLPYADDVEFLPLESVSLSVCLHSDSLTTYIRMHFNSTTYELNAQELHQYSLFDGYYPPIPALVDASIEFTGSPVISNAELYATPLSMGDITVKVSVDPLTGIGSYEMLLNSGFKYTQAFLYKRPITQFSTDINNANGMLANIRYVEIGKWGTAQKIKNFDLSVYADPTETTYSATEGQPPVTFGDFTVTNVIRPENYSPFPVLDPYLLVSDAAVTKLHATTNQIEFKFGPSPNLPNELEHCSVYPVVALSPEQDWESDTEKYLLIHSYGFELVSSYQTYVLYPLVEVDTSGYPNKNLFLRYAENGKRVSGLLTQNQPIVIIPSYFSITYSVNDDAPSSERLFRRYMSAIARPELWEIIQDPSSGTVERISQTVTETNGVLQIEVVLSGVAGYIIWLVDSFTGQQIGNVQRSTPSNSHTFSFQIGITQSIRNIVIAGEVSNV